MFWNVARLLTIHSRVMVVVLWRALSRFYSGPDHKKYVTNAMQHPEMDPSAFLALVALRPVGLASEGQLFS